jgi:hypothetical protein
MCRAIGTIGILHSNAQCRVRAEESTTSTLAPVLVFLTNLFPSKGVVITDVPLFSRKMSLSLSECDEHDSLRATAQMCSEQGHLGSALASPSGKKPLKSKLGKQEESQAYGKSENISVL